MDRRINLVFATVPRSFFHQQQPIFSLQLTIQHSYFRLFRNFQGQVRQIQSSPHHQSSSVFQIQPSFLSHSSACNNLVHHILSSLNVDAQARLILVPRLVARLISITEEQILSGFSAVALVEIVHEEVIDVEEFLMMMTMMDGEVVSEPRRGVSSSTMKKMKKKTFTIEESGGGGECAICLEEMSGKVELIKMECAHTFHENCIFRWLKNHNSCPMCRRQIEI